MFLKYSLQKSPKPIDSLWMFLVIASLPILFVCCNNSNNEIDKGISKIFDLNNTDIYYLFLLTD